MTEANALVPSQFQADVEFVFRDIGAAAEEFMLMKNRGRRILEMEKNCRRSLSDLWRSATSDRS
jgi:hypothetical protein